MKVFDPTFGVCKTATAIANLIENMVYIENTDSLMYIQSSPFYNGRETGICLTCYNKLMPVKAIIFGQCRNSDSMFVDVINSVLNPINPPTINDMTDEIYKQRTYFGYGKIMDVAKYIADQIEAVYN